MEANTIYEPQNKLTTAFKEQTALAHRDAESAQFVKQMFHGNFEIEKYMEYLWAFHKVYKKLEEVLERFKDHKMVSPIYFPELFRAKALEEDLKYFEQNHGICNLSVGIKVATEQYYNRLQAIENEEPMLIVAHAYTRYLGDLSGGQILGKILFSKFLTMKGLSFYAFPFDNYEEWKVRYKTALDSITQEDRDISNLCAESNMAFKLNGAIFKSLV